MINMFCQPAIVDYLHLYCYNCGMENQNETESKFMFEITLFFYQLETMLKNQNSMLTEKISEGDLISSSLAFNNSLILASLKKIIKDNPELEKYSSSESFQEKLKGMVNKLTTTDTDISNLN